MKPLETLTPRDQNRIKDRLDNNSKIIGVDDIGEEYRVTFCDGNNAIKAFRIKKFTYSNNCAPKKETIVKKTMLHLFRDDNEEVKISETGTLRHKQYLSMYTYLGCFAAEKSIKKEDEEIVK